jgi:hypothetical protein
VSTKPAAAQTNSRILVQRATALTYRDDIPSDGEWVFQFRRLDAFQPNFFANMLRRGLESTKEEILPVFYSPFRWGGRPTGSYRLTLFDAFDAPVILRNAGTIIGKRRLLRLCPEAFSTEVLEDTAKVKKSVDCIVRYHHGAEPELLRRALLSIGVQQDVVVSPLVMLQNLSMTQLSTVREIVQSIPRREGSKPLVENFISSDNNDMRSRLLKEGLLRVSSDYVAFLDYDDLLFPFAYKRLINRLQTTNKAITFGRVYRSQVDRVRGPIIYRDKVYEYNRNYYDFLRLNHAPIHSFLIDARKVDIMAATIADDHKYMEDYYMMLQLVNDQNTDWESLHLNDYIGEYVHYGPELGTLSITSEEKRQEVAESEVYQRDLSRIHELVERKTHEHEQSLSEKVEP